MKINCPICRGSGKSDFGMTDTGTVCAYCDGNGEVKLVKGSVERGLREIKILLLSVANPYIDVPQSIETVHAEVLKRLDDLLEVLK